MTARATALLLAVLALGLAAACGDTGGGDRPVAADAGTRCAMCGMDPTISQGRFVVDFEDGARIDACSGHCVALFAARHASPVYRVRAFGHDVGELTDGRGATYLIGADVIPEASMPPSVFAFRDAAAARAFLAEHGGRLAGFGEVLALAEADEKGEHGS